MKPVKRFQLGGGKCVEAKKETVEIDHLVNNLANGTFLDDLEDWINSDSICNSEVFLSIFNSYFMNSSRHRMAQQLDESILAVDRIPLPACHIH